MEGHSRLNIVYSSGKKLATQGLGFVKCGSIMEGLLFLGIVYLYAVYSINFAEKFPGSYSWSELLINYEGGFVRRGLFGELVFQLSGFVSPKVFSIIAISIAYALYLVVFFRRTRSFDAGARISFLMCPATFLFPIYDPEAFARKDAFILAALAAATCLSKESTGRFRFTIMMGMYLLLSLAIETSVFYMPVAVAMYCWRRGGQESGRWHLNRWLVGVLAFVFIAATVFSVNILNRHSTLRMRDNIVMSWHKMEVDSEFDEGALNYLSMTPVQGVQMALLDKTKRNNIIGYILVICLSSLPFVLIFTTSRQKTTSIATVIGTVGAIPILLSTFLIGADWGRYIYLALNHIFMLALAMRVPGVSDVGRDRRRAIIFSFTIIIFACSWRVRHYSWDGNSALVPGVLFLLVHSTPK